MSEILTVVFDLDGTLVDTAPDLAQAMNAVLKLHGRDQVPPSDVRHMVGQGARALMARGMAATGEPADDMLLDQLFDEFLEHYIANIAAFSVPFDGVVAQVERCRAAGFATGICTNKAEAASHRLLDELALTHLFDAVVGGDSIAVRKPDPEHIHETVRRAGGTRGHAIMVGDSNNDIDAARNACVPVIAVSFGYTDTPVRELGPDVTIDHFDEFWKALEQVRAGMAG
jgi:phosphoglycolate phosphatase